MTTEWIIIIALLLIAAALAWVLERKFDEAGRLARELERAKQTAAQWERRAVQNEEGEKRAEQAGAKMHEQLKATIEERDGFSWQLAEMRQRQRPRAARVELPDGMTLERIEEVLAGTAPTAPVMAITTLLSRRVVEASDRATDEPNREIYTPEMRLHDAGKAHAYAEALAAIQQLAAAREEKAPEEKAA